MTSDPRLAVSGRLSPARPLPALDLDALQRGEPEALGQVYEQYAGPIVATLTALVGDPMTAEDLLHDLFVGLPTALARYEERGQFAAWLHRVAVRLALASRRRGARREALLAAVPPPAPLPPRAEGLADRLLIAARLAELSDNVRTVVVLREIAGMSHREIGTLLGLREGTVMTRHSRGMATLRRALEHDR